MTTTEKYVNIQVDLDNDLPEKMVFQYVSSHLHPASQEHFRLTLESTNDIKDALFQAIFNEVALKALMRAIEETENINDNEERQP